MQPFGPLIAFVGLAVATLGASSWGQTVYRCGNMYGQTPCPGGIAIEVSDSRTPAQKAQTDAATAQAARSADKLEHERKALEQAQAAKPAARSSSTKPGSSSRAELARSGPLAKKKEPEYFTAGAPADLNRPKTTGQKTVKEASNASPARPVVQ